MDDFIKDWYGLRNSLSKQDFESGWRSLISKHPTTKSYLEQTLYSTKERWALAWISNEFTSGQSTQCVEGVNAIIKSNITSKTSLSELASVLDCHLARESMFIRYDSSKEKATRLCSRCKQPSH